MNIKDSQSEKNLVTAFISEAGARNKYMIYALQAEKEGHNEIAELFYKMADNELEHSKVWFNYIYQETNTLQNLKDAAHSENNEWKNMYPQFADKAREEGYESLALTFEKIASIESDHERKFTEAMLKMANPNHDLTENAEKWIGEFCCVFCGYTSGSKLIKCPVCLAQNSFTEI